MTPEELITGLKLVAWVLLVLALGAAGGQLLMAIPRLIQGLIRLVKALRDEGVAAGLALLLAAPIKGLWRLLRFVLTLALIVFLLSFLLPEQMGEILALLPQIQ
ncbi:MAG: hypothetical protein GKR89_06625 [Candidatus Latescibacteria bacterium]|nr:hypothetical protein [Candidatus Latescibacterota bacterium]